jgi:queuine/archaeosine tRNA-ribosyltransferase
MFEKLLEAALASLVEIDLSGHAVGVGEPKQEMRRIMAHTPRRRRPAGPLLRDAAPDAGQHPHPA